MTAKVKNIIVKPAVAFSVILDMFQKTTVDTQRDHSKRVRKARYVYGELFGDQLVFHAARYQGRLMLVDGYTRCEAVVRGLTKDPGNVVLIIHAVDSRDALKRLYDQFNNPAAAKKAGDRFDEGLRLVGMLSAVQSKLVSRGPRSAVKHASGLNSIRDSVEAIESGVRFVDGLMLDKTHETVALLAVYYAVGQYGSHLAVDADNFIRRLNQRRFEPTAPSRKDLHITDYREVLFDAKAKGAATGGGNVKKLFERGLGAYANYTGAVRLLGRKGSVTSLTLAEFRRCMELSKKAV